MIEKYSHNKLLKRLLVTGIVLGIIGAVARLGIVFFGVFAGISVVGGGLSEQSTNEFMASLIRVMDAVSPYLVGLGAVSIFLHVSLFPDKESRGTLLFWAVIMISYLLAKLFITWL